MIIIQVGGFSVQNFIHIQKLEMVKKKGNILSQFPFYLIKKICQVWNKIDQFLPLFLESSFCGYFFIKMLRLGSLGTCMYLMQDPSWDEYPHNTR
jgi:hypothetical protein